jgi:hypothetical protein
MPRGKVLDEINARECLLIVLNIEKLSEIEKDFEHYKERIYRLHMPFS